MKKLKRIIEKQCPMCHDTCYMMVEAERYGTIMEYIYYINIVAAADTMEGLEAMGF